MSANPDRLEALDAELAALGVDQARIDAMCVQAREGHLGDLAAIDEALTSLAGSDVDLSAVAVARPVSVPPPPPSSARTPSTEEIGIDELEEAELELDEVLIEAEVEPAPSDPVPAAEPGLTESVLFGVLEGGFEEVEAAALGEGGEVAPDAAAPSADLAAMLEAEGVGDADLAALEAEGSESESGPDAPTAEAGAEGTPEGDDDDDDDDEKEKGFFRKLFG